MADTGLTALQLRLLGVLSTIEPRWTLSGGAALVGFHLHHRATRDLDLFWRARRDLDHIPEAVISRLVGEGFKVQSIQRSPAFSRLAVNHAGEVVVLDLVADPVAPIEPAVRVHLDGVEFDMDSRHEILVNKLNAVLGRTELRDLVDIHALLTAGGDLEAALHDAPAKDSGFSPLTLAWLLDQLPVRDMARSLNMEQGVDELDAFRQHLILRLTALAAPAAP